MENVNLPANDLLNYKTSEKETNKTILEPGLVTRKNEKQVTITLVARFSVLKPLFITRTMIAAKMNGLFYIVSGHDYVT